jgi:DNA-binding LacI/PurR family transcriptional regulator
MMQIQGISRETAKTVLKRLATEGYIIQKPGKGSFVADLGPKQKKWALILPHYCAQYEELLFYLHTHARGLERAMEHFIGHDSWQEEIRLVGECIDQRYEAVIVAPTLDESQTADFYRTVSPRQTHLSLIDHTMAGSFFSYVIQSYDLGVQRALRYLVERSDKTLVFVRNRIRGGRNLLRELMEATFASSCQREILFVDHADEVDREWIEQHRVGGFFCCDDADAIRIIGRCREQGMAFEQECALVSYGNTYLARYFTPRISAIDPHNEEIARRTVEILQRRIDAQDTSFCQYIVQPTLVVRET